MRLAVIAAVVAVAVLLAVTLTAGAPDARGHAPDSSSSDANVRADLIDVSVDLATGGFDVLVEGRVWLSSGDYYVRHAGFKCDASSGCLELASAERTPDGGARLVWRVGPFIR